MIKINLMLQSIKNKIKERQEIKEILNKNSKYLSSGKYRIIGAGKRIVYLKNDDAIKFIEKNQSHLNRGSSNSRKLKLVIKKVITELSKIKIEKIENIKSEDFNGSLIMITRNQDLKIFDFDKSKVLNLLNDKKKYDLIKGSYARFNVYFDIPKKKFNSKFQYYVEDYIEFKPYHLWTGEEKDKVTHQLLENYIVYSKEFDKKELEANSVKDLFAEFQERINHCKLKNRINEILHEELYIDKPIIRILQHGDLNFNNLLFINHSQEKCFVIDWEECESFILFYDILNLICVEYLYQKNSELLKKYMYGMYDYAIGEIFKNVGLVYDPKIKKSYLAVYIMERILKYEIIKNNLFIPVMLERCLMLINEFEIIEKRIENSEMIK